MCATCERGVEKNDDADRNNRKFLSDVMGKSYIAGYDAARICLLEYLAAFEFQLESVPEKERETVGKTQRLMKAALLETLGKIRPKNVGFDITVQKESEYVGERPNAAEAALDA